ncbi:MAG: 4-(cytidine 5'-diphospho)-2-C-methyl-D-erythritol kinase, partial [Oscillospiraceae bacterium]
RAAECFFEETGIIGGALIDVQKKIPSQAGMAGGSADAAAVLAGLNALYQAGLSVNELQKIGLRVGADVPYCLVGGTARVQGVGEVLIPIKPLTDGIFVIVKPKVGISTVKAYEKFDALLASAHPDNDKLVEAVKRGQISDFQKFMYNVLEQTVELSVVNRIEESLLRSGASAAMMTGSGSAVFGVFHSRILASKAYDRLSQNHSSFLAEPIHFGVRVVREE